MIVEMATSLLGSLSMRYVIGQPELGQSPETGFDCSGFAKYVLSQVGLYIPDYIGMDGARRPIRHANEFWDYYGVMTENQPEPGDLIFFSRKGIIPTHMGIVRDQGSYIHAPGNDDSEVRIDEIKIEAIEPEDGTSRILYIANPIGFKVPTRQSDSPTYRHHQQLLE